MATKVKRNAFVTPGAKQASIASKLDKMIELLGKPERWTKGAMSRDAYDKNGYLVKDKKGRVVMAYCLVGAGRAVGNGVQLWYELCYTIEAPKMADVVTGYRSPVSGKIDAAPLEDMVIGYNDRPKTLYIDIKKVLLATRARIKRYGLGHFPKLEAILKAKEKAA